MRVHPLQVDGTFPDVLHGGAVSIGNFDGVHRGHQALITELHTQARRLGGPAVAVTFDPHPLAILAPDRFLPQLMTIEDRADQLLKAGADRVGILQTNSNLLQLSAQEFLDKIVRGGLRAKFMVEGFNFGFGRGREGNTDFLEKWTPSANIGLSVVPALRLPNGEPISSSRVRSMLESGDVVGAVDLLGRPYRLWGVVAKGASRGASLGFPTANLESCKTVIPGDGVYAGRAVVDGTLFAAAINVGPNPTFATTARKVEAHLLDFSKSIYGQKIAIDFIARIRDVQRFDSKEKLVTQLNHDVETTRSMMESETWRKI
jgi:riboflavin kinase / FMN adenylyltransferase